MVRRVAAAFGAFAAVFLLTTGPAYATFTENKIGCSGSAVITNGDKQVTVNANDAKAKLPRKGSAAWQGAIGTTTHNHSGEVRLKFGGFNIGLGSWGPSANAKNENSKSGTKKIPSQVEQLPAGKYVVSGFHQGNEGRCAGEIEVEVEGGIFSSPIGIVSVIGTVLTGAGLVFSAMVKGVGR